MRTGIRAGITLAIALISASSVDFEAIFHAHGDWSVELRAHERSRAEGLRPCDRTPHWDRARSERRGACVACLVSANATARSATSAQLVEPPRVNVGSTAPRIRPPFGPRAAPRRGRAPPRPLLRAA